MPIIFRNKVNFLFSAKWFCTKNTYIHTFDGTRFKRAKQLLVLYCIFSIFMMMMAYTPPVICLIHY